MEHSCIEEVCECVCLQGENTLNEMEIFSNHSTQCSGVKCVTPSGGQWGEGEMCNGTPVTYWLGPAVDGFVYIEYPGPLDI